MIIVIKYVQRPTQNFNPWSYLLYFEDKFLNIIPISSDNMVSTTCDSTVDIPGPLEGDIWTVCHVIIALLSLTGDSVILLGTVKYRAIKLHRVIVVIIQHIAVSNLMLTLFRVLPSIAGLVAQGWTLGTFMCLVNLNLAFIFTPPPLS